MGRSAKDNKSKMVIGKKDDGQKTSRRTSTGTKFDRRYYKQDLVDRPWVTG
jgi:hypothetical protein